MDFSVQFCEYNYSNPDYDQIYRPKGSGDYLFLLFKTPMKVYLNHQLTLSKENTTVKIMSSLSEENMEQLDQMAEELCK